MTCEDGDDCTKDECSPTAGCTHTPAAGSCDDGSACTLADHCVNGVCEPGNTICSCDQDEDCAAWDDGDPCSGSLTCQNGLCKVDPATRVVCPAGSAGPCTFHGCDPKTGACSVLPVTDGAACSDGDPCTAGDACQSGQCVAGPPACPCEAEADCDVYDDGNRCNGVVRCVSGQCKADPSSVVQCPGGAGPCAGGACDPATGTCSAPGKPDGAPCDDQNPCTTGDACHGEVCQGTPTDCNDHNPCTDDACGPAGTCTNTPNTYDCNDGDPCTEGDACQGGTCVPGPDVCKCTTHADCEDDGDLCNGTPICLNEKCVTDQASVIVCSGPGDGPCLESKCIPQNGTCVQVPINEGLACSDGDACTTGDTCTAGTCTPTGDKCTCQAADTLLCDTKKTWSNYAFGATANVDAWPCSAGNFSATEFAWTFSTSTPKAVTIWLKNEVVKTEIFVLADNGTGCRPDACLMNGKSTVEFLTEAGVKYFIVVDAKDGGSGKFDIEVTCNSP